MMGYYFFKKNTNLGKECQNFIDIYQPMYFKDYNKKCIVPNIKQTFKNVEDEVVKILDTGITKEDDVFIVLMWKLGKIKGINKDNTFIFNNDVDANNKKAKIYSKEQIDLKKFIGEVTDFCVKNNYKKESYDYDKAQKFIDYSKKLNCEYMWTIYLITLLYFYSKGDFQIYDKYAMVALTAIEKGILPGEEVEYWSLPNDNINTIISDESSLYRKYINKLNGFRNNETVDMRKLDQALWVYGHWFKITQH